MVAVSHLIGIEQLPTDVSDRVRLYFIVTLTNQERDDTLEFSLNGTGIL